jgi:enhancing lycopene biosynthesis protein 2
MKNVAVVLSGCGVFDGSEINEVVLSLLALEEEGASYQCFAPDKNQYHVLDHTQGTEMDESRNVMIEAARITRGKIAPLAKLDATKFDALLVPGGFGVAKNLSDFAFKGESVSIAPEFLKVMSDFKLAGKPAGYMCIAPVLLPKVYPEITCTIGQDAETAAVIENLGGKHIDCAVDGIVVDSQYKVVTTPAYMLAQSISEANQGIQKLVAKLVRL